jgi:hypothetical protein
MGVFQNNLMGAAAAAASAGGAGFYTHQIANSVRVSNSSANSTATNYLYRDGGAGNRDTWTIGMWIKRARISTSNANTSMAAWGGHSGSGSARGYGMVNDYTGTINGMSFENNNGSSWHLTTRTSAMYRDLSAWTHVCWRYDSTQSTEADRARMYVNGELITNLQSTTYPAQNADHSWNGGGYQFIGTNGTGTNGNNPYQGFDGYIAEVVAIDGTSLDPMDNLVETKNGVIIPKDPSGLTFGSEGFYLKFESSSDLGNDSSGNNNDFTVAGIATHDQMLDTPTFGGSNGGNFPIINVLDPTVDESAISECNLKITEGNQRGGKATFAVPLTGKWYWEAYCYADSAQEMWNGITGITADSSGDGRGGSSNSNTYAASWSQYSGSNYFIRKYIAGTESAESGSFGTTKHTILGIAINRDDNEAKFYKDNALQFTTSISATQEYFPAGGMGGGTNATTIQVWNFGQDGTFAGEKTAQGNSDGNGFGNFYYSPPTGHLALCSGNLPLADAINPAETDDDYPSKLFSATLYTGNGSASARNIDTGVAADLVWIKRRDADSMRNMWYDSSRGVGKYMHTDTDAAEDTSGTSLSAFNSDGFQLSDNGSYLNNSSSTYVAWNWKVNDGSTSTNSTGSVNVTQQVDPSGGFSISTYSGAGGTGNIGHGLSAAPTFVLVKQYSGANDWCVYAKGAQDSGALFAYLNSNSIFQSATIFGNTEPSSTLVYLGDNNEVNHSGRNYVAYCWTNIDGYIKSGFYTGNANTDGPFVYTGFKPALVIVRYIGSGESWVVVDNKRDGYNPTNKNTRWNSDVAEASGSTYNVDLLSNGFKPRTTWEGWNGNNYRIVYLAMAHNPFNYATAG